MNIETNETFFRTSLILKYEPHHQQNKIELKQRLEAIERLSKENAELQLILENLRLRMAVESHPLLVEFCDVRIHNLELLEECLSNRVFKSKEKEKIIELLIEGAAEIWALGDLRASTFLKRYLGGEIENEDEEPDNEFTKRGQQKNSESREYANESYRPDIKKKSSASDILKSLYRGLVKALHPDKEPDEKLKSIKNSLMKKVTEAYEQEDIHTLLKLTAEHVGIDDESEDKFQFYLMELDRKFKKLKEEKKLLTKLGPLSRIYKTLYSRNPSKTESKIKIQLNGIRIQIKTEHSYSAIYSDDLFLKTYLHELLSRG